MEENNPFAAYSLGGQYLRGQGVEQSNTEAYRLYTMAAVPVSYTHLDVYKRQVQKYAPGKQFGELLIGNYDLLEREREVPLQMSLNELLGETIPVEQILKERIIPCKKRTMNS